MNGLVNLNGDDLKRAIALYVRSKGYKLRPILKGGNITGNPEFSVSISHYKEDRSDMETYSASVCVELEEMKHE